MKQSLHVTVDSWTRLWTAPPILWLAYGVIKLRAIDFLGLFAAENVVVSMAALVLAHSEREALIGRSMQNIVLAVIFLASLTFAKPLMFHMSRQLSTGNDPAKRESFDLAASQPNAMSAYRILTWGWTAALLIKAAGSYYLGAHFRPRTTWSSRRCGIWSATLCWSPGPSPMAAPSWSHPATTPSPPWSPRD